MSHTILELNRDLIKPYIDNQDDGIKQTLSDEAETRARLGAHNLLPMTVEGIKAVNTSATWAGNVATLSGMTFTVLTDGDNNVTGVNITGQNSGGTVVFGLASHDFGNSVFDSFDTSSTEYIATSGITGDSSTTYGIKYQADIQSTYIRIASGYNFGTGKTIQPMIRLASDSDSTYQPYVMTNQQLTETLNNFEESITGEVVDSEPYVLRQGKGNLADMALVGGSLAWNQLIYNGNFASTSSWTAIGCTFSVANKVGKFTASEQWGRINGLQVNVKKEHKYFLTATIKGTTDTYFGIGNAYVKYCDSTSRKTYNSIINGSSDDLLITQVGDRRTSGWTEITVENFMCIDLTALFGTAIADYIYSLEQATAGAGVAWFRKYFPNAYYGYQSGKIESVNVASRKVVGKNLYTDSPSFDGFIDANIWTLQSETLNGHPVYKSNTAWRGMWKSIYLPVGTYTFSVQAKMDTSAQCYLYVLQGLLQNPAELDVTTIYITPKTSWSKYSGTFTVTKAGTVAFRIECYTNNMGLYISEYQLEIGSTATDYEPYKEYTFPFANKQLRGIPKLVDNKLSYDGDIWKANEGITRKYIIVTYDGSEDELWQDGLDVGYIYITPTVAGKKPANNATKWDALCNYLEVKSFNNLYFSSEEGAAMSSSGNIAFHIPGVTDISTTMTAVRSYLSSHPLTIIYERETPTTESAEPFQNPQRAFIEGTEEFIDYGVQSATRDVSIPVGNNTTYQLNETLPPIEDYVDGATALIVNDIKVLEKDRDVVKFSLMNRSPNFTRVNPKLKAWVPKVWGGNTSFQGYDIWTDGDNIYYSNDTNQYVLDKKTSTWIPKVWNGEEQAPYGYYIWSDGDNIYHNSDVYNKAKSSFTSKTWSGLTVDNGGVIWTDGDNIYYSKATNQYVLNKATSTWVTKTWNGLTNFYGYSVWTDGDNIYYSMGTNHYVLNKATSTWVSKTWNGLTNFNGANTWSDGVNVYYSNNDNQYVLDKISSTWVPKTWTGCTNIGASNIWSDGDNIYYSNNEDQYVLKTVTLGSTR